MAHAQEHQSGIAHYRIRLQNGVYKNAVLYFNDSATLYVYNKRGMDDSSGLDNTSMSYDSREGGLTGMAIKVSEYDDEGAQLYRDFKNRSVSFRETGKKPMEAFTVVDNWMEISWKIENVFREIAGYHCQKATGSFRGRTYIAWFTRDVPVSYGPWKLFGLPGLIVKAAPKHQKWLLDIGLTKLCYPCDSLQKLDKPEETKMKTIREYVYYTDHILEAVMKKIQEHMPDGITVGDAYYDQPLQERRNNRLERLFEWEKDIPCVEDSLQEIKLDINKD